MDILLPGLIIILYEKLFEKFTNPAKIPKISRLPGINNDTGEAADDARAGSR